MTHSCNISSWTTWYSRNHSHNISTWIHFLLGRGQINMVSTRNYKCLLDAHPTNKVGNLCSTQRRIFHLISLDMSEINTENLNTICMLNSMLFCFKESIRVQHYWKVASWYRQVWRKSPYLFYHRIYYFKEFSIFFYFADNCQ